MRRKNKLKMKNILVFIILIIIIILAGYFFFQKNGKIDLKVGEILEKEEVIEDFSNLSFEKVKEYAEKKHLKLNVTYDYSDEIAKDNVISGSEENGEVTVKVSLGSLPLDKFKELKVNELGNVPIMMYHGIQNVENKYTGGNIDKDGYNRTSKAFLEDLEFYYQKGYRMIRLEDYINGIINVEMGYSPIILTFDDGNANNFQVIKKNDDGTLVFDENSAIGVLEKIKNKYPDMNVTATFFLNGGLCNQKEYNEDIMKWLIENGYDIGNHTISHVDFKKINTTKTQEEVGALYQKLEDIIPGKYVKIIALPFGSPYVKSHANFAYILDGEYNGNSYHTESALRVGWEPEVSPFNSSFDKTYLKRCRAYDNNGKEFDITMVFKNLEYNKYISDGNAEMIVIPRSKQDKLGEVTLKVVTYEE